MADRRPPSGDDDRGLDIDAAFDQIVANWTPSVVEEPEERGRLETPGRTEDDPPAVEEADEGGRLETPDPDRLRNLFRPAWDAPDDIDPDEHFIPPPPPPLPPLDPRRKWAWLGMFGSPTLMLLSIIFAVALPGWVMFVLAAAFVGGFVYLVATMDDGRGREGYDDGARV